MNQSETGRQINKKMDRWIEVQFEERDELKTWRVTEITDLLT